METPEANPTLVDNRRRADRRDSDAVISVSLETGRVSGRAENLSAAGVFFFTPDQVRVRVEVNEDGKLKVYAGRLVRVESFSQDNNGFAIEFDRA
ncbi:MAG: PilZ domain-containing protein [Planctomycetes bacterium]|nr:PilZ domain-containing protein [Planctomycetota bacterium]